jgi:large subunit ribosomal protein L9
LGSRGDVVTVKDGYARNFLIPKKLAREATAGNLKSAEQERKKWDVLADQERTVAQKAADSVKGMKIVINKRTGDHGNLFGSVTANDIADALLAKGVDVDKRRIELAHPIKTTGLHEIDVRLHKDVTAHIQVEVLPIGVESVATPAPASAPAPAEAAPAADADAAAAE